VGDKFGGQLGQAICMILRPAVFDRDVLSFDITGLAQSVAEGSEVRHRRLA
jgi:hypothetical protein